MSLATRSIPMWSSGRWMVAVDGGGGWWRWMVAVDATNWGGLGFRR